MKFLAIIRILKNPTAIICFSSFSRINVERLEEEESVKFFSVYTVYAMYNIRLVQSIKVHEFSYDELCCGFFNDHRERRKGEFN